MRLPVFLSVLLLLGCSPRSPETRPPRGEAPIATNLMRYEDRMFANEARLVPKWRLKQMEFETDGLYSARDLTQLVGSIFTETAGMAVDTVDQVYDTSGNRFRSTVRIGNQAFTFQLPADGSRIDAPLLLPQLNAALLLLQPDALLALCRTPYDPETTILVYGRRTDLEKAVDEGLPADVPGRRWSWPAGAWPEGQQPEITLPGPPPPPEALQAACLESAAALRAQGLPVPSLTAERLVITDIFETGTALDLCIDGELCTSPATIQGNIVRCHWDPWGVLLAYTLVRRFGGSPAVVASDTRQKTDFRPQDFRALVEKAFAQRESPAVSPL